MNDSAHWDRIHASMMESKGALELQPYTSANMTTRGMSKVYNRGATMYGTADDAIPLSSGMRKRKGFSSISQEEAPVAPPSEEEVLNSIETNDQFTQDMVSSYLNNPAKQSKSVLETFKSWFGTDSSAADAVELTPLQQYTADGAAISYEPGHSNSAGTFDNAADMDAAVSNYVEPPASELVVVDGAAAEAEAVAEVAAEVSATAPEVAAITAASMVPGPGTLVSAAIIAVSVIDVVTGGKIVKGIQDLLGVSPDAPPPPQLTEAGGVNPNVPPPSTGGATGGSATTPIVFG
jgi:hypothetical protein